MLLIERLAIEDAQCSKFIAKNLTLYNICFQTF